MALANARPDLAAHQQVVRLDAREVARQLVDLLGARLVAYLGGVGETRAVRQWLDGGRDMRSDAEARLREALTVALTIASREEPRTVQAWFQGLNPQLDDRSPARLLRDGELGEVGPEVRHAARAFVVGG
jgi:hypothetical protein